MYISNHWCCCVFTPEGARLNINRLHVELIRNIPPVRIASYTQPELHETTST